MRWREGASPLPALPDRGWAYLTVQIHECDAEHAELVRDPDGNWLEISQRASLTGPLPN